MRVRNEEEYRRKKNELMKKATSATRSTGWAPSELRDLPRRAAVPPRAYIPILLIWTTLSSNPPNTV